MAIHTQSRNSTAVKTSLDQTQVEQLRTEFRGRVIQAGDPAYEEARKIYNGMIDKRPALIARCRDTADVISAVRFARDQDLPVAVRAGGHHAAGLCLVDDGLVIDLSLMKGIHLDLKTSSVRVQPGCTLGRYGPCHQYAWHGCAQRFRFHDGYQWADPGRRHWFSQPCLRADD